MLGVICINTIDKIRTVILIFTFLLFIEVAITFNIFQEQYTFLVYINYSVLLISAVGLLWGYYYYQITPIYAGLILDLLHVLLVILLMFLAKWIHVPRTDLLGIPLSIVVGFIIYLFTDKLVSIIVNLFNNQ